MLLLVIALKSSPCDITNPFNFNHMKSILSILWDLIILNYQTKNSDLTLLFQMSIFVTNESCTINTIVCYYRICLIKGDFSDCHLQVT